MQALTSKDIRGAFAYGERRDLVIPDLSPVDWGVLDYYGWVHPSGHNGYVVMPVSGELVGIKLRRFLSSQGREGKARTHMCSWCNHVYRGGGTAMFSTPVQGSDGRRTIGNYICKNLDCSVRMRNLTSDPPTYLPETIELKRKISRLENAVTQFMGRAQLLSKLL